MTMMAIGKKAAGRILDGQVHANGSGMIVCGTRRHLTCVRCGWPADRECDWKVPGRSPAPATSRCDKPICASCTTSPAAEKDLCPEHAQAWVRWQQERGA